MAYNFPNSPAWGDTFLDYKWDGEKWVLIYGGIAKPFVPLNDITGIIGWWDASVFASMTFSGSAITNVADQSGAGNHLVGGGTNTQPLYDAVGFNGRPSFSFNNSGTAHYLQKTSFPMGTGNTLTFWVCTTLVSFQAGGRIIDYLTGGGHDYDNVGSWVVNTDTGVPFVYFTRNSKNVVVATVASTPYRIIGTIDASGAFTIYLNGVATAGSGGSAPGNWVNNGTFRLGRGVYVFDDAAYNGKMGEAGVATGYSNASTVAQLDLYLKNKWGM